MMADANSTSPHVPLNDVTRPIVVAAHFAAFVVCTWQLWVFLAKITTLQTRIHSPFLFLIGCVWLQIGSAIEIANHYYVGDFELNGFQQTWSTARSTSSTCIHAGLDRRLASC
jgi:hypothetical protein